MCDFTYQHYQEILSKLKLEGYICRSFQSFDPTSKYQLILRHDIDVLTPNLLDIGRIEQKLGMSSIFHFLITSELYNPLCTSIQTLLQKLREQGHYIGWHIDPSVVSLKDFRQYLEKARIILGDLDSWSLHRPALNKDEKWSFCGEISPISNPNDFKDVLYKADSTRKWKTGCPCMQHFDGQNVQLLTHPNSWNSLHINIQDNIMNWEHLYGELHELYFAEDMNFIPKSTRKLNSFFTEGKWY